MMNKTVQDQALFHASVDSFFLIIISIIIFFMQGGFAFLEAGSVRSVFRDFCVICSTPVSVIASSNLGQSLVMVKDVKSCTYRCYIMLDARHYLYCATHYPV